jgi:hypothetical protein
VRVQLVPAAPAVLGTVGGKGQVVLATRNVGAEIAGDDCPGSRSAGGAGARWDPLLIKRGCRAAAEAESNWAA